MHSEECKQLSELSDLNHAGSLPDVSAAFEDLITRLLDKNPATRIGWEELPQHPFWESPLPQAAMPKQPLLEAFITQNNLAPHKGGTPSHEVNSPPHPAKRNHVSFALTM